MDKRKYIKDLLEDSKIYKRQRKEIILRLKNCKCIMNKIQNLMNQILVFCDYIFNILFIFIISTIKYSNMLIILTLKINKYHYSISITISSMNFFFLQQKRYEAIIMTKITTTIKTIAAIGIPTTTPKLTLYTTHYPS